MFTCYWSSLLPLLNSGASKIGVLLAEGESGIRNEGKAARAGFLLVDISGFSKQKQILLCTPPFTAEHVSSTIYQHCRILYDRQKKNP
ncbi:hypothetical protein J6590_086827, partial [Homalodisca vitripennis]